MTRYTRKMKRGGGEASNPLNGEKEVLTDNITALKGVKSLNLTSLTEATKNVFKTDSELKQENIDAEQSFKARVKGFREKFKGSSGPAAAFSRDDLLDQLYALKTAMPFLEKVVDEADTTVSMIQNGEAGFIKKETGQRTLRSKMGNLTKKLSKGKLKPKNLEEFLK